MRTKTKDSREARKAGRASRGWHRPGSRGQRGPGGEADSRRRPHKQPWGLWCGSWMQFEARLGLPAVGVQACPAKAAGQDDTPRSRSRGQWREKPIAGRPVGTRAGMWPGLSHTH